MNFYPGEEEFLELCGDYQSVPVSAEWPSDTETPITVYNKVARRKHSFLLESVEGGERLGRYSFIGLDPMVLITCHRGSVTVERDGRKETAGGDPFRAIAGILEEFSTPALNGMPRFYGGAVGYLGYDLARSIERLPDYNRSESGIPDCVLMVPRINIIIDHLRHTLRVVVAARTAAGPKAEYGRAKALIGEILAGISGGNAPPALTPPGERRPAEVKANLSREEFMDRVERAREYIRAGDILQVVLSRRIEVDFGGDPFGVYRRLRRNNPSPYLFFLDLDDVVMAGSSPEMLIRVEGGRVETRPIAGTRPRGATAREDEALAAELLSDAKERAEHLMLVDLGRNDVGRVSRPGTVKVPQFMEVERYSHVMHLVSSVTGELAGGLGGMEALKACFPAGTVSGAPKVRAMEIIEELEPARRGPYAGAVGYIGFNGNVDTAIAIRTVVFHGQKAFVQVGAGIVADSDPAGEFSETENKARALLNALTEEDGRIAADY